MDRQPEDSTSVGKAAEMDPTDPTAPTRSKPQNRITNTLFLNKQAPTPILKVPIEVLTCMLEYACAEDDGLQVTTEREIRKTRKELHSSSHINLSKRSKPYVQFVGSSSRYECRLPLVCRKFRDIVVGNSLTYKSNIIIADCDTVLSYFAQYICDRDLNALHALRIDHSYIAHLKDGNYAEVAQTFKVKKQNVLDILELDVTSCVCETESFVTNYTTYEYAALVVSSFNFRSFAIVHDQDELLFSDHVIHGCDPEGSWADFCQAIEKAEKLVMDTMIKNRQSRSNEATECKSEAV